MNAVIAELRRGPRTTSQIREATGLSRNAVQLSIQGANERGHRVVNVRGRGGHRDGLYLLLHDGESAARRRCAFAGCPTLLSRSNLTDYCRSHLPLVAYYVQLQWLAAALDEITGEVDDEQLALAVD